MHAVPYYCHPSTQTNNPRYTFIQAGCLCFCWVFWCMHFAWNSNTAVYSRRCTLTAVQVYSLCTLVHGQTCGWLNLDKSAGDPRVNKTCIGMPALTQSKQPSVHFYLSWSIVFLLSLLMHALCLEQLQGCIFQPLYTFCCPNVQSLYTCLWTNLRVTYSEQIWRSSEG